MAIDDSSRQQFVVVHSNWSPDRAARYVGRRDAPFVVVLDREDPRSHRYYVLRRDEALSKLTRQLDTARLALKLDDLEPVPAVLPRSRVFEASFPRVIVSSRGLSGLVAAHGTAPAAASRAVRMRGGAGTTRSAAGNSGPPVTRGKPSTEGASEGKVVSRYLGAELPSSITAGDTVSLLVNLRSTLETGPSAPLALGVGALVEILVSPLEGLSVVGNAEGSLEVSEPQADLPFRVRLKAEQVGETGAKIYAFHAGVTIASFIVHTRVVAEAAAGPSKRADETERVTFVPRTQPDLSLYIFEEGTELTFRLQSADGRFHLKKFGPTELRAKPREYFRSFFRDVENMALTTPEEVRAAARKLGTKGATLFNAVFPVDLRLLLWELRDRIHTVQITSDEPWVPWEVCRLSGLVDGRVEEGPFFAEGFEVTRWLYGAAPPSQIRCSNMALVVPGDSGLAKAVEEAAFVKSLAGNSRKVTEVPADFLAVTDAMASGKYDAWHFTGHGRADAAANADHDAIELANREELTPEDVAGQVENMLLPRPLVFFNACQTSQGGLALASIGGWAQRFICPGVSGASAAAFIGSYWSVIDQGALVFAKEFYAGLLAGRSVGRAAKDARAAVRQTGDPTWLAYTVYADPSATLVS